MKLAAVVRPDQSVDWLLMKDQGIHAAVLVQG